MISLRTEQLEELRDTAYWRKPSLRVTSLALAEKFVNTVHLAFTFQSRRSELPCLWHAACGRRDPQMPHHTHHDPAVGLAWTAKDVLPGEKRIYYGKALKKRPTMISLSLFPFFFAAQRHPDPETALDPFLGNALTPLARRILEVLLDSPPMPTRVIKEQVGGTGSRGRADFDRAMADLQGRLLICKVAETSDPFTFIWGRLDRWLTDQTDEARAISCEEGQSEVLRRYFDVVVAAKPMDTERLFGWAENGVRGRLAALVASGALTDQVQVDGRGGWLLSTRHVGRLK